MAIANVSAEDSFLSQLESVRVELRERVARAHQVLQERETALLSELQELEDSYRGEGVVEQIQELSLTKEHAEATLQKTENQKILQQIVTPLDGRMRELEVNLETARDRMRQVELEWNGNLQGILSKTGSIRVRGVPECKEKRNPIMVADKQKAPNNVTEGEPNRGLKNSKTPAS